MDEAGALELGRVLVLDVRTTGLEVPAVGAGGVKGYVYNADLLSLGDKATPDDETPEIPNSIHLYAKDGTTIIGEFLIGQING